MEILKSIHYAITAISPFLMIVFCIYGLVSWADCDEDGENIGVALAVITLIVFILSLAAWGIGDSVCAKQSAVEELNAVENIVALSDNNMVNGRIYMRGGYIDNDLWYQYMVKVSNDGFVANKLKANTVTLYYTKGGGHISNGCGLSKIKLIIRFTFQKVVLQMISVWI